MPCALIVLYQCTGCGPAFDSRPMLLAWGDTEHPEITGKERKEIHKRLNSKRTP